MQPAGIGNDGNGARVFTAAVITTTKSDSATSETIHGPPGKIAQPRLHSCAGCARSAPEANDSEVKNFAPFHFCCEISSTSFALSPSSAITRAARAWNWDTGCESSPHVRWSRARIRSASFTPVSNGPKRLGGSLSRRLDSRHTLVWRTPGFTFRASFAPPCTGRLRLRSRAACRTL